MKYTKQQNRKNVSEFIVLRTQSNSYVVICGWKNKINPKIIKKKKSHPIMLCNNVTLNTDFIFLIK